MNDQSINMLFEAGLVKNTGVEDLRQLVRRATHAFSNHPMPLASCLTLRTLVRRSTVQEDALFTEKVALIGNQPFAGNEELRALLRECQLGGWALDAETIGYLVREIVRRKPKSILEFGSGVSTLVLAHTMRRLYGATEHPLVWSIEQGLEFLRTAESLVQRHGLLDTVRFLHAPLGPQTIRGWATTCYQVSDAKLASFFGPVRPDFVLIDGPAADYGERFGTLPLIERFLDPNAVVFMDDGLRDSELAIADWWNRLSYLAVEGIIWVGKGLVVGRPWSSMAESPRQFLNDLMEDVQKANLLSDSRPDPPVRRHRQSADKPCAFAAPKFHVPGL